MFLPNCFFFRLAATGKQSSSQQPFSCWLGRLPLWLGMLGKPWRCVGGLLRTATRLTLMKVSLVNPLTPRRTQGSPFTETFNSILRRDHQKKIPMSVAPESVDEKSLS